MKTRILPALAPAIVLGVFLLLGTVRAQEWAKARLEKSPRHGEWLEVKQGDRTLRCFLVFPEVSAKVPAVVVVHEIFGLTDWVRGVADQLAEAGYIAIAPDLLSGQTFEGVDDARKAISKLPDAQVMADLDAVTAHVGKLPASNGKVAVAGFCWGGAVAFKFANHNRDVKAAYVFYGTGPGESPAVNNVHCPVYGFYAENDARVNATIPKAEELMRAGGKTYEHQTYIGAGHGFMRAGEAPDANSANRKARDDAWSRWRGLLGKL